MTDTLSPGEYVELMRLMRQLIKRIEHLEKFTGAVKEDPIPCHGCGLKHGHHPWCETRKVENAKRT